jgi:amidase
VTLPAGFGKNGLPLGIQITGRTREDLHVLRVAKWAETVLDFDPGVPGIVG